MQTLQLTFAFAQVVSAFHDRHVHDGHDRKTSAAIQLRTGLPKLLKNRPPTQSRGEGVTKLRGHGSILVIEGVGLRASSCISPSRDARSCKERQLRLTRTSATKWTIKKKTYSNRSYRQKCRLEPYHQICDHDCLCLRINTTFSLHKFSLISF